MRADRLLSILMLLQTHARLSAAALARELEVSQRTIYRDMEALSAAGVPVYMERGKDGGCCLVEDYRTNLTGLTPEETRALFLLNIPEPLEQLGMGGALQGALRKLTASLPAGQTHESEHARSRVHLDTGWWFQEESAEHLDVLRQAVWEDRCLRLTVHTFIAGDIALEAVEPLGLVAKANTWHLVYRYQHSLRALAVGSIMQAELLPQSFQRPADFDLAAFWQQWRQGVERANRQYAVTLKIAPELHGRILQHFGKHARRALESAPAADERGLVQITLGFESIYAARDRLLGYGGGVEVLAPLALRLSLQDFARQAAAVYDGG